MEEATFSSMLLGKPSHDGLIKLQDYEIKLLEVMKKTISMRIKCDKEYANSITQVALQGAKIEAPMYNSPLHTAWKEIVHELSQMGKTIKKSAEHLQSSTYEKVVGLIKDKIAVKKYYSDNRERIDNELLKVIHTEMDKKSTHYQKLETETGQAHKSYDAAVEKKNKLPVIEKCQDKYRKSTMKFHHAHNEYVLHVQEAGMYQDQYRSQILPQLMEGMQYMHSSFVETMKNLISEWLENTSPCRDEFVSCHKQAQDCWREIDMATEYGDFLRCQFTSLEPEAVILFDSLRSEGATLPSNQIVLNSLSLQGIEHLKQGFESDQMAVEAKIEDYTKHLHDLNEEIQQVQENLSSISRFFSSSHIGLHAKQLDYVTTQLYMMENEGLRNRQRHLFYLLDQTLKDLGERDPLPGLFLPELDTLSTASADVRSPTEIKSIMNKFVGKIKKTATDTVTAMSSKKDGKKIIDMSKTEREQAWFHGAIPRREAENLIVNDGDFLLRESTQKSDELVLTSKSDNQLRHFKFQRTENGMFRFDGDSFYTILDLILFHFESKKAITNKSGCVLKEAICKDKWQMTHDDIEIVSELGHGNFGTVHKAVLRKTNEWVAVKTCKDTVDKNTQDKFLSEAKILKGYDHPNIVRLVGICTDCHPIYIVMELVMGGDLLKFLKASRYRLYENQLLQMCRDACAGLAYLEEKKCIHRDVAARNCLITETNSVKITDFGMSREEEDGVYSVSGGMKQIPMKWTAPESMNYGKFTFASDVWSFGVLSWEIFSYGGTPYVKMTNQEARDRVEGGYRMPSPTQCPNKYYTDVMMACWQYEPRNRPTFADNLRTIDYIMRNF
uniref:Tyrosine-protein kinase n=1 Tax=Phallusia mammillata TaxID=59560 RepID=A0A6F9DCZ5_9ASCI|nr:tyrosine-protein kinase Fer [Phallusia mammillata]